MAEINIEQPAELIAYLRETGRIGPEEVPRIEVLAGGVSNRTVLVQLSSGQAWVLKQALAKLRVAVDWFSPPERIEREALGLRWLHLLAPPGSVTPLVFEDPAQHLLAMAAVPQPHENWKSMLLVCEIEQDHIDQFGQLLGTIHRRSAELRTEVEPVFADRGYFESLRLEPYYRYTATQVPDASLFLTELATETLSHRDTLVHGDYSPKNVLVYDNRLILLDHEVIHFGDPGFDIGFSLTHLLSKAHHLTDCRLAFLQAADQYWNAYLATAGATTPWVVGLEARAVRHTLACLLARVAGRSPLEYLDAEERARQQEAVVQIITHGPPKTIPALIELFSTHL